MPQAADRIPTPDDPAFIRAGLVHLLVPLDTLRLDDHNARVHSTRNLAVIAESLRRFGQYRPIVVQSDGLIVRAGNGTVMAARSLGWKSIAAVVVPLDEVEATALAIAENKAGDLARWGEQALAAIMTELRQTHGVAPVELDLLGWSEDDLAAMPVQGDWQPPSEEREPLESHQRERGEVFRIDATPEQQAAIFEAIQAARAKYGTTKATDGQVFAALALEYLNMEVGPGADE